MQQLTDLRHYLLHVLKTKGFIGIPFRVAMLIKRFDLDGHLMNSIVHEIETLGQEFGYAPAMIVPAVVVKRHAKAMSDVFHSSLEWGVHGHTHKSFRHFSLSRQKDELKKAKSLFSELGIDVHGFRAPYLSWTEDTLQAVGESDLCWDSDQSYMWDVPGQLMPKKTKWISEKAIRSFYNPLDARDHIVIPRLCNGVINIPVTLPDDEIIIDRFGIRDDTQISAIWMHVLEETVARGSIFVLQLHPERYPICQGAMRSLLEVARNPGKSIWTTGMNDVAEWWLHKRAFKFDFESLPNNEVKVRVNCDDRAAILGRNIACDVKTEPFDEHYELIRAKAFTLGPGKHLPCIGIPSGSPDSLYGFLDDMGFAYETMAARANYSLILDAYDSFGPDDEMALLQQIHATPNPILRFGLWPAPYKSAFLTSHDLDCVTLTDFLLRVFGG
jgi:hypothetical protein